jgi:hypothetical protein
MLIARKPFCEISRDELLYLSLWGLGRILWSVVMGLKIQGHLKAYNRNLNLDGSGNMLISNAVLDIRSELV